MPPVTFPSSPQRILIIKPSSIGDVVHALPILNLLHKQFPAAAIDWLVTPACSGLLNNHPHLANVILFERKRLGTIWRNPLAAKDLFALARTLRKPNYDLVVDLQGLFRSGWLSWQTGARVRIGFANAREIAWAFYTHRVPIDTPEQHAIDRYLKIASALGCPTDPVEFPFAVTDADHQAIARHIPDKTRYAVILPGSNWPTKRWPVQNFAALVQPLKDRFNLQSVVAGGSVDSGLGAQIPADFNLVGKTSLPQLIALLKRADLVIANDSGPMHIASALGRPLVTLFGPTNPIRTGPFRRLDTVVRVKTPCSPCYSRKCSHCDCLTSITIQPVLDLAAKQLGTCTVP